MLSLCWHWRVKDFPSTLCEATILLVQFQEHPFLWFLPWRLKQRCDLELNAQELQVSTSAASLPSSHSSFLGSPPKML